MINRHSLGDHWPILPLSDVVEFLDHQRRPVTESDRVGGLYPYYGANGPQGTIDDFIFDEPLILLAEDGGHFNDPSRGIAYQIAGKTWVNNHAHVLRPKLTVDLNYLCKVLEHYDVSPFVTGTTRGKLTKAGASGIPIPLPPMEQQRRIAAILDQAEALRTKRRQALGQLETLLQSLFNQVLEKSSGYKVGLTEITLEINDCPHSTPDWTEQGVCCLRTSNLGLGDWIWDDERFVSESTYQSRSARGHLAPGDIILSREGTVGIAAIVPKGMRSCMGQRLVQVRPILPRPQQNGCSTISLRFCRLHA